MRLTRSRLRRIIKEELGRVLSEQEEPVQDFGTVNIALDKKTGEPVTRMGTINIKGSPPADEEEALLLDLLVSDDMIPNWDYSTSSERNAFYQALASAALDHFRSLPAMEVPASAKRLGQHLIDRARELPEIAPYVRDLVQQVLDAASVASSEAPRSGIASPD